MSDWNEGIIEEFRANEGRAGGMFEGVPLLLLHHAGARTGIERVSPLIYQQLDAGWAVFASKAGADHHPDWYHNIVANPDTKIELGTETVAVTARVATGDEYDRIWSKQKMDRPQFADYQNKTSRVIPVIVLEHT